MSEREGVRERERWRKRHVSRRGMMRMVRGRETRRMQGQYTWMNRVKKSVRGERKMCAIPPSQESLQAQATAGALLAMVPIVIASMDFGTRIKLQRECEACNGTGLVQNKSGRKRKCRECGGFLPWESWKRYVIDSRALTHSYTHTLSLSLFSLRLVFRCLGISQLSHVCVRLSRYVHGNRHIHVCVYAYVCYRFFTSDVGNGGVLLIPRGQKGLLYAMPEKKKKDEEEEREDENEEEQIQIQEEIVEQTEQEM